MTLLLIIIVLALIFDYINGFHDAANAIATVVATKVLSPFQAVLWAAFLWVFQRVAGFEIPDSVERRCLIPQACLWPLLNSPTDRSLARTLI